MDRAAAAGPGDAGIVQVPVDQWQEMRVIVLMKPHQRKGSAPKIRRGQRDGESLFEDPISASGGGGARAWDDNAYEAKRTVVVMLYAASQTQTEKPRNKIFGNHESGSKYAHAKIAKASRTNHFSLTSPKASIGANGNIITRSSESPETAT